VKKFLPISIGAPQPALPAPAAERCLPAEDDRSPRPGEAYPRRPRRAGPVRVTVRRAARPPDPMLSRAARRYRQGAADFAAVPPLVISVRL